MSKSVNVSIELNVNHLINSIQITLTPNSYRLSDDLCKQLMLDVEKNVDETLKVLNEQTKECILHAVRQSVTQLNKHH